MVECTNTRGVYTSPRIYSFNRGHAEREQVTQQVAVFTGFPGDETRAVGPVWWSPTPLPLPRQRNRRHHRRLPSPPPPFPSSRPRRAVSTPPLNGHKAPDRNLRVEALTARRQRRRRRRRPSVPSPAPRIEIGRAATVKALDLSRLGAAERTERKRVRKERGPRLILKGSFRICPRIARHLCPLSVFLSHNSSLAISTWT